MRWLTAVAAAAALALLAAALLSLTSGGGAEAQTPVPPPDYIDGLYLQVSAGNGITCGVTYLGNIRCWGRNEAGPLYVPSTLNQTDEPRYSWTDVAVTSAYACGLRSDGIMECWGLPAPFPIPGKWPAKSFVGASTTTSTPALKISPPS